MMDAEANQPTNIEDMPLAEMMVRLMRADPLSPVGIEQRKDVEAPPADIFSGFATTSLEGVSLELVARLRAVTEPSYNQTETIQEKPKRHDEARPGSKIDFNA